MSQACLVDYDNNPVLQSFSKETLTLREILPTLNHDCPFEFILLLDLMDQKIVSKFKLLKPDHCYKLIPADPLYQQNLKLNQKTMEQEQQINELTQKLEKLQQETQNQSLQLSKYQIANQNFLQESQEALQKKNKTQEEALSKLESQNKILQQGLENEQQQSQNLVEKIAQQKFELDSLKKQHTESQTNYQEADKERKSIKTEFEKLKNQYDFIFEEHKKYEGQVQANRLRILELERINNEYTQRLTYQEKELDRREKANDKLSAQIDEKDKKLYNYMDNFIKISDRLQTMTAQTNEQSVEQKQFQDQINQMEKALREYQLTCQELTKKNKILEDQTNKNYEQFNRALEEQKQQTSQEILSLTIQVQEKSIQLESQQNALKHAQNLNTMYIERIEEMDGKYLKEIDEKTKTIASYENSQTESNFRARLSRVIELSDRPYISEMNFAIEELYRQTIQQVLVNQQSEEVKFEVQVLQPKKYKEIDQFSNTIYEVNNLDFISKVELNPAKILTGKLFKVIIESTDHSYDQIQLFKSSDDAQNFVKNGLFAFRQIKGYQFNERETQETAINESVGLLIAQNLLNQYYQDLQENHTCPKGLQFPKPYIFSKTQSFRQYLSEMDDQTQINSFQSVRQIIQDMNDDQSNTFYDEWRVMQLDKKQEHISKGFIHAFCECIKITFKDHHQNIIEQILQIGEAVINNEFQLFTQFLDEIHIASFPIKKFYSAYQIHQQNEGKDFVKYNGGHVNFDKSEVGKFLSAFSYYSIKQSHRQICVSHLQGVGEYLYDPLISSYDGILNKLDQGIKEIRTIESKCETAKPEEFGQQYLHILGITRKQIQMQQIG